VYIVNIEWFTSYLTRCYCIRTMQLVQKIINLIQTNKFILQLFYNTFPFMNRINKETNKICWKCWGKLQPWLKSLKMLQTNLIMYMKGTTFHRPTSCFFAHPFIWTIWNTWLFWINQNILQIDGKLRLMKLYASYGLTHIQFYYVLL
jgi:hypothetical protein